MDDKKLFDDNEPLIDLDGFMIYQLQALSVEPVA